MQEGVEEVDGQEAQVGQTLQQTLHAGVADLRHLAGVQRLAEANVHVVFVQPGVRPSDENIPVNGCSAVCWECDGTFSSSDSDVGQKSV